MEYPESAHRKNRKRFSSGWGSLVIVLLLLLAFTLFPSFGNLIYRHLFFPAFRFVWDYTIGLLPFPLVLLVIIALVGGFIHAIIKSVRGQRNILWMLTGWLASWVASFFWMWGFHYACPNLMTYTPQQLRTADYYAWALSQAAELDSLRRLASGTLDDELPADSLRQAVKRVLREHDWPLSGAPEVHALRDGGWIRRLGIAGIYLPYAGEAYTSATFTPLARHFIMAHELSHAYGVTHEGEADYVAWQALRTSPAPALRYAGALQLFMQLRGALRVQHDSLWRHVVQHTPRLVQRDIELLRLDNGRYPEWRKGLGERVNDRYLKLMGQADGVATYDLFLDMAWQELHSSPSHEQQP